MPVCGQRDHRSDTRYRHQAPTHLIVSHDGQQTAVQDAELLGADAGAVDGSELARTFVTGRLGPGSHAFGLFARFAWPLTIRKISPRSLFLLRNQGWLSAEPAVSTWVSGSGVRTIVTERGRCSVSAASSDTGPTA